MYRNFGPKLAQHRHRERCRISSCFLHAFWTRIESQKDHKMGPKLAPGRVCKMSSGNLKEFERSRGRGGRSRRIENDRKRAKTIGNHRKRSKTNEPGDGGDRGGIYPYPNPSPGPPMPRPNPPSIVFDRFRSFPIVFDPPRSPPATSGSPPRSARPQFKISSHLYHCPGALFQSALLYVNSKTASEGAQKMAKKHS